MDMLVIVAPVFGAWFLGRYLGGAIRRRLEGIVLDERRSRE